MKEEHIEQNEEQIKQIDNITLDLIYETSMKNMELSLLDYECYLLYY